jgi:transcription-repair coupling factor (superfamily II helicase)
MPAELGLWTPLLEAQFYKELETEIRDGARGLCLQGLIEGSRALVLMLLAARTGKPQLIVLPDDTAVEAYQRDLVALATISGIDPQRIRVLPALDADPYDSIAPHPEVIRERVTTISCLLRAEVDCLLLPVRALLNPVPAADEWAAWTRQFRIGDTLAPDVFILEALTLGYRREDPVGGPGEISRRGGIIDIFPMDATEPVRIELFGDSVESIRSFDTDNQRSTGHLEQVRIGPAMESPPTDDAVRRVTRHFEDRLREAKGRSRGARQLREHLEQLRGEGYWPGFESLAGITVEHPQSLLDLTQDMLLILDEPARTDDALIRAWHDLNVSHEQGEELILPPPETLFIHAESIRAHLSGAGLMLQELVGEDPAQASKIWQVASRSERSYSGRLQELTADLTRTEQPTRTVCMLRTTGSANRLDEIFGEYGVASHRLGPDGESAPAASATGGLFVTVGSLRTGFELWEHGLTVLSERGLFGERRREPGRKGLAGTVLLSDFRDLKKGGLVVHVDHGIARYTGLGRPRGGSLNRDFMVLEFAAGDRLFVPVDRLDIVQKYRGVAGKKPDLARLGGPSWEKVKARVRKSVQSMAGELLELYARRKAAVGHPFAEDGNWQQELEDAFPFELTVDQERAITEIKSDMESTRTMDRLLVGDVGFGKTELAVRAAFKAVLDGRQVALLAPTTVLALQHFETFRARFAPYPLRVEMISRFRTAAQIKKNLRDLEAGAVDVLIGTHRLLSKDVKFHKLGLLIIDEEQRFGVTHKERLRQMSIGLDVLVMTATPIPRSLQMSMAGIRDLSLIETPPPGRMAIQTYIIPFRKNVIGQAIRQELHRKGQVFIVHNKIETLPSLARAVKEMVPEARVIVGHGRVGDKRLESLMLQFVNYEADVFVTTTIIENGLDIPRANTIIVNRADRFGLAQLYQLRGRVGRSRLHAYAYMVIPGRQALSDVAAKRLRALQEFSELGAGFRLAAADLEIRGAGELLGSRQHGHIGSLGFDLYCQLLERAVSELKGEPIDEALPVTISLGVDIKVPQTYLPDSADRLVLYKRLSHAKTGEDIDRLQGETEDRCGHMPSAAQNLFAMGRLRLIAVAQGIKNIDLTAEQLQIRFHEGPRIEVHQLVKGLQKSGGTLTPSGMLVLPPPTTGQERIAAVESMLTSVFGSPG